MGVEVEQSGCPTKGASEPTPSHVEAHPPMVETNWAKTKILSAERMKH